MKSIWFGACSALFVAMWGSSALAVIHSTPPGLQPGDKFHLMFVTTGSTQAFTSNPPITGYDIYVSNEAVNNGLSYYYDQYMDWYCLGSFAQFAGPDVSAISRFNPAYPVYLLDGAKIANNGPDLWDGTIQSAINVGPDLSTQNGFVWTGSEFNGTPAINNALLNNGLNNPRLGQSTVTFQNWVAAADFPWSSELHLYAFSTELTAIPEPGTLVAAVIGGLFVMIGGRKRRAV